jgi:hypothetical protein
MPTPIVERHLTTDKAKLRSTRAIDMIAPILQANPRLAPRTTLIIHPTRLALNALRRRHRRSPVPRKIANLLPVGHDGEERQGVQEVFGEEFLAGPTRWAVGVVEQGLFEDVGDALDADFVVFAREPRRGGGDCCAADAAFPDWEEVFAWAEGFGRLWVIHGGVVEMASVGYGLWFAACFAGVVGGSMGLWLRSEESEEREIASAACASSLELAVR